MLNKILAVAARWEAILVVFILVAIAGGSALSPHFLNTENLWSQSRSFIVVGFLALGLAAVVITGDIDLSGESILAICAVLLGVLYEHGVSIWAASIVVVALGSLIGLLNGVLTAALGLPSLVVTLASLISFRGLAYVILEERPIASFPESFVALGNGDIGSTLIPQSLVAFGIASLIIFVMLHLTIWGRRLFAIGANPAAAALSGVPVRRLRISAFVLSGALAGCAAVLLAARYNSVRADVGTGLLLSVLTVVLLGGISIFGGSGNLTGLLLSLVLVGLIQNGMSLANIAEEGQHLIVGALLIAAVVIPRLISGLSSRRFSSQRSMAHSDAHDRKSG